MAPVFGRTVTTGIPTRTPLTSGELWPGREVVYGGRKARVLAVAIEVAPSGSEIVLCRLQFPRGGEQTVFAAQLEAAT